MSVPNADFIRIIKDIQQKKFKPLYVLSGEEPYYLDKIAEVIDKFAIDESQKDFNQVVLYGQEADAVKIIEACKQYPMMAERVVVIIKEAHRFKLDGLESYFKNPQDSTILVLVHPKKLDGRKTYTKALKKNPKAEFFESKKHYDNELPRFVEFRIKQKGLQADPKILVILSEYLGNDLHRIDNEITKLSGILPKGTTLTPEIIEEYVGVSKIYNPFEFGNAILNRDFSTCMTIAKGFEANPKAFPLLTLTAILYGYFSKILLIHAHKLNDPSSAASALGVSPYFVKDYINAARKYSYAETLTIMALLRKYDRIAKGLAGNEQPDTLTEMVCRIVQK
ncbi:MAG: DNA polymerase III subunit delta [Cryomorphaceae bacterium]|nr:DNA polymerase III subunit delta [Cryomorphaceae bacterium]